MKYIIAILASAISLIAPTRSVCQNNQSIREVRRDEFVTAPSTWVAFFDYPKSALKNLLEGDVNFILTIDQSGVVTNCEIKKSSRWNSLDMTTCSLVTQRAKFVPSPDRVTRRYSTGAIGWRCPFPTDDFDPNKPYLGIVFGTNSADGTWRLLDVLPGPAYDAGARKRDILSVPNKRAIEGPNDLNHMIQSFTQNGTVTLVLSRNGERQTVAFKASRFPKLGDLHYQEWKNAMWNYWIAKHSGFIR